MEAISSINLFLLVYLSLFQQTKLNIFERDWSKFDKKTLFLTACRLGEFN